MQLKPKDVACACGHITNLTTRKLRCIKCGKDVFYDENEKKLHRRQSLLSPHHRDGAELRRLLFYRDGVGPAIAADGIIRQNSVIRKQTAVVFPAIEPTTAG